MDFIEFQGLFSKQSEKVLRLGAEFDNLYVLDIQPDLLWETYLESFPPQFNQVFRERRAHDCSTCRHVVKAVGALVAIDDMFNVVSVWDFDPDDDEYQPVVYAMRKLLDKEIDRVFLSKVTNIGTRANIEELDNGDLLEWNHLHIDIPHRYVTQDVGAEMEKKRALKHVFGRSLSEIGPEAVQTTLDLIEEGNLIRGDEWKGPLTHFQTLQNEYLQLSERKKGRFVWRVSASVGPAIAKIRNHSIGTLLTDLSDGLDVEQAIRKWESVMAPANYKRPKAVFTARMVEQAKQVVAELGLEDSLYRRFAILSDLTINNVLWANRNANKGGGRLSMFDELKDTVPVNMAQVERAPAMGIDEFMERLDEVKSLELLFTSQHQGSLVSLIAPEYPDAAPLFKWGNNFSWAYNGNITDSDIRRSVQERGGRVDGVFRFSHSWNHPGRRNSSLMDLHVFMPSATVREGNEISDHYGHGRRIGWNSRNDPLSQGIQDVDYTDEAPDGYIPVENITFPSLERMPEGTYVCKVHNWRFRAPTTGGFRAEIEFGGQVFQYDYPEPLKVKEWVTVATVKFEDNKFSIKHFLQPSNMSSVKVWGINTNQFHPVSTVMYSPNHWDGQGVGNRHYIFNLLGCINDGQPNGFFNEFLRDDFLQHRKVFEALGGKMKVAPSTDQVSGLGFSSTQRNSVIARVNGKSLVKIVF